MDASDKANNLLESILYELRLQNVVAKKELVLRFNKEFLDNDNKKEIFKAFDGINDAESIAKKVGCSPRTVQRFIKDLVDSDLIEINKDGKTHIPLASEIKVLNYYIENSINDLEE